MIQQKSRHTDKKTVVAGRKSPSDSESNDSRQSLLNRSRKILGDSIELGEAPRNTFEIAEQSSDTDFLSKRRAQVRQAQRTHRQRTQTYIRTLEKEVVRLRNCESAALAKVSQLEKQYFNPWTDSRNYGGKVLLNPKSDNEPLVSMSWQQETHSDGCSTNCAMPNFGSTGASTYPVFGTPVESEDQVNLATNPTTLGENPMYTSIFEDPRVGIEFILALERPCLRHIRDSPLDHKDTESYTNEHPDGISGHLFTASLSLWQPTSPSRDLPMSYSVSQQELDRLLQTSLNIGVSGGEITPVQLWHRLQNMFSKDSSRRDDLGPEVLEVMVTKLSGHVKCLHYGAVVDLTDVDTILEELFPYLDAWP